MILIILILIFAPVLFWAIVVLLADRTKKSSREKSQPAAPSTGNIKRQPLFSNIKNKKKK